MSKLFSPLTLRAVTFKNRIVMSPMCMYSSKDGFANDWHLVHLGSRAIGGAGLIIVEATAVSPEGRITHGDLGIWKDEHIDFLKRITTFIKANNSVPGIQLAHAGRKASSHVPWDGGGPLSKEEDAWQTVAPSAVPFTGHHPVPLALDDDGIKKVVNDFKDAAERAVRAGFEVLEIHAAHGYLLHEFLSPLSNKREDNYGGAFENRIRLLVDVVQSVRMVWPERLPLFVRISATDWVEGGWTIQDSVTLGKVLMEYGVDLLDCSSGGVVPNVQIPLKPGYQTEFAQAIKYQTGLPTGAVGLITKSHQAELIIAEEQADLVLLAREFLRDPYFPLHAAIDLEADIPWPVQYERAKR
ncbi:MAG TPA: NADPH dehydrogenase NamA [Cytophagaceae bacterium]